MQDPRHDRRSPGQPFDLRIVEIDTRLTLDIGQIERDDRTRHLDRVRFGYAFPSTAFELEIRTKHDHWSTDCPPADGLALRVDLRGGSAASDHLNVELGTLDQPVHDAVRRYQQRTVRSPLAALRLTAEPAMYGGVMGNAEACTIAQQVRRAIADAVARHPVAEIHLFAAVPQGLATMIGHRLNALPPVQHYEYDGREYHPSYRVG